MLKEPAKVIIAGIWGKVNGKMVILGYRRVDLHHISGTSLIYGLLVFKLPFCSADPGTYVWNILDEKSSAIDTEFMV